MDAGCPALSLVALWTVHTGKGADRSCRVRGGAGRGVQQMATQRHAPSPLEPGVRAPWHLRGCEVPGASTLCQVPWEGHYLGPCPGKPVFLCWAPSWWCSCFLPEGALPATGRPISVHPPLGAGPHRSAHPHCCPSASSPQGSLRSCLGLA